MRRRFNTRRMLDNEPAPNPLTVAALVDLNAPAEYRAAAFRIATPAEREDARLYLETLDDALSDAIALERAARRISTRPNYADSTIRPTRVRS
jgi:hypothetical protein